MFKLKLTFNNLVKQLCKFIVGCNFSKFGKFTCRYRHPQPEWSLFREASFGHGELKIVNSTHAFWSWHRNDDDESVSSDQVWISSHSSSGCLAEKNYELRKILIAP